MNVIILGSAGWMPSYGNETNCILVEHKEKLLMLDAGTGVCRLSAYKDLLLRYDTVHVILGHYHLDHTIGISYFSNFLKEHNLVFYTPDEKYYGESGQSILDKLLSPALFARQFDKICKTVACVSYDERGFDIDDIHIAVKAQQHSAPSFAFLIDGELAYITDTVVDSATFDWANKSKVMFHECWSIVKPPQPHSSLDELKKQLCDYGGKVFLIHHNPDIAPKKYINELANCDKVKFAIDGMTVEI